MSDEGPPFDKGLPGAMPKPCSRRLGPPIRWCLKPEGHVGDCEGVVPAEFPVNDLGPKRKPRWG